MAIIEKSGFLKYKDASGNTTLMYPITTKDNVDGMDDIDAHVASQENPHNVTADQIGAISYSAQSLTDEQKAQAKENIGVTSDIERLSEEHANFLASDEELLTMMLELDALPAVQDADGAILIDSDGAIILG